MEKGSNFRAGNLLGMFKSSEAMAWSRILLASNNARFVCFIYPIAAHGPRLRFELKDKYQTIAFGADRSSSDTGKGKTKFKFPSCTIKVSHGYHLVEGKAGHDMEDYHVAEYRKKKGHTLGLFAIFDGHLGYRIPIYLKDNLFNNILEEPNFWDDAKTAIKNAYRSTDEVILKNSQQLGPGGSTAVTAIVIDGKDLWVANIGDSRAVMCKNGIAYQLTVDHEPRSERRRIEEQGGFVTTLPGGVSRVN